MGGNVIVHPNHDPVLYEMLEAERDVVFVKHDGKYIVTSIPVDFNGGPVPGDWRAESRLSYIAALERLAETWRDTPDDFQWPEDDHGGDGE